MADDIKLSIAEQRVLNDVFKRLTENMGYTENALNTPLGTLLGALVAPAPVSNVKVSIRTCGYLTAKQIGDGQYDARWNAAGPFGDLLFGPHFNSAQLTLDYQPGLPDSTRIWAEIAPNDPDNFFPPVLTVHFKTGFAFPSPGQVNDVIQALRTGDIIPQTHLGGGTATQNAQYARWDGDSSSFRAKTIGSAGNSLTLFLAADGAGPLPNVTFVGNDFVIHYVVNVSSYKDVKDAINAVANPNDLIVAFVFPGDDTFILDNSLDGYGGPFEGGQDFVAGATASLKLFDLGNHHIDTEIQAISSGVAGNNLTIQTGRNDALTGVVIQRSGNDFTVFFQNNVSTVGDFEAAIAALSGGDALISVKTASSNPSRVLTYDNQLFIALDGDFPGSVNINALTSNTVGTTYLNYGQDADVVSINREQWGQFNVTADNVLDGGQTIIFFGDGQTLSGGSPTSFIHRYAQTGGATIVALVQDSRAVQAAGVAGVSIADSFDLPGNKPPSLFYTATFDGLNGSGYITNSFFGPGSFVIQGSNNDPFYQVVQPTSGDRMVFLAELGGVGFRTVQQGINGQGFIPLTGPGVINGVGKEPQGGDRIMMVTKFDVGTGTWVNTFTLGTDFSGVIQFSGPSLFQNNAGLDTSGVSLSVLYTSPTGVMGVLFDGNGLNQGGLFSSTIDQQGRLFQKTNQDLSARSFIALFARPGR